MDRGKQAPGTRGPKAKITQQPPDLFIALGSKQQSGNDPKRPVPLPKPSGSSHLQAGTSKAPVDKLKREGSASSLTAVPPSKKLKVTLPGSRPVISGPSGSGLLPVDRLGAAQTGAEPWEALALECDSSDLLENIINNINAGNNDKAVGYVIGAIKAIKNQRFKICKIIYSSLLLACGCKPTIFTNENIITAILSVLRRDITLGPKASTKGNPYVHILLTNLLQHGFSDVTHWPESFVKFYIEDAFSERICVDNPYCKAFIDNIVTAFNTKVPPKALLTSEIWTSGPRDSSSPLTINSIDDEEVLVEHKMIVDNWYKKIYPRFSQSQESIEQIVLEAIKEQLARRQQPEAITKNFVRFLSTACGLVEIRVIAVSRIETWLHNHKLMKPAQELLAYLCYNCSASSQRDLEVIANLSKLRLKNKPMVNFFNNCLREMVYSFPENLYPLLKYTIYNELSNARNANSLIVVGALFQVAPEASADAFAGICLELLLNKDDYLRSLRALLKEINRVLRHDFNLLSIAHALLKERKDFANNVRDFEFCDRVFYSLADLVCMCMLLCVSPQVKEAATQNKRDVSVLKAFQLQVSSIQREAVTWLHDSAVRIYRPNVSEFQHVLLKVLFLEQAEQYWKVDSWPGENERNLFLRLASEVPLLQATLLRLLSIGVSKEHPITPTEIIEITDQLIRRAANLPPDCAAPLVMDKTEIFEMFFSNCVYNYPENISLPIGYTPPKLAISGVYWKCWLMLLILAAHNPATIGNIAWNKYPMLRMFMEMCITNHFQFPPPTMSSLEEDFQSREQQIIALEKQTILEFESHLAAASTKIEINEQNSLLLPQLMELRPEGDARRPPLGVLEQLQVLNNTHRMGHLLCRSRNPDFLLDIMSRQGGTAHMPWLAELVHSSEGALAHLPVQCLCEYLLSTAPTEKLTKHGQLLAHLRTVVNGNDPQSACEVLEYLFRRLTSDHSASRSQATKALNLILAPTEETEGSPNNTAWLTNYINQFPHLMLIKHILNQFLRQAVQIETIPSRVASYINFLSTQEMSDNFLEFNELITDLSSVIIERHSVASCILQNEDKVTLRNLLTIFALHLQKAKELPEETYSILQNFNTEYVIVTFATGEQCAMQNLIINAAIVLLTCGPLDNFDPFTFLLDQWFPTNMAHPRAYSPETSEQACYLPPWMKLRMIRSNVSRLVDAAIEELKPPQLILFIQSFGIPPKSVSKLLHHLDKATLEDPKLVMDSVLDKTYMIQLVEVQNKRGAVGGMAFLGVLQTQMSPVQDVEINIDVEPRRCLPSFHQKPKTRYDESEVIAILNKLFFNPAEVANHNKYILMLIKAASVNEKSLETILQCIKSMKPNDILPVLKYNSAPALFRLLFRFDKVDPTKIHIAQYILHNLKDQPGHIATILKQYLKESGIKHTSMDIKMEVDEVTDLVNNDLVTNKKYVDSVLSATDNLGEKLGQLLLKGSTDAEKTGLFLDWLSTLELEIASSDDSKKLQMDLLFSRQTLSFRPLLMSLLLQRASWKSLHGVLTYLLHEDISEKCPVSALDFLTALTQSPKLWQGRDKAVPKHFHFEDILQLNKHQAMVLVKYIIEEAKIHPENWKTKMESRLQLLLKNIKSSAGFIMKNLFSQSETDIHARELMLLIYMSIPASGQRLIEPKEDLAEETYSKNCPCAVDEISHSLLSALAATPRGKDWARKSQDLELCARKLAATHPILVLRQMPMLAGSLKGRAQYDWGVLKNRGHLTLFTQVLGILELLEPVVFYQTEVLCEILDSYFLLLQYHGHNRDVTILVNRIVTFMQNWMTKNIKAASKYLQEHGAVLNDIQLAQPGVRPLLSSVSLPMADQSAPTELLVGTATPPVADPLPQNWQQLLAALHNSDNLNALQELDHITNKKPQLLENVSQHLYNAISSANNSIRSLALILIIRWLKHNPNAASQALPAILACLDSNNGDVVSSILDRLSELVTVMQEYARVILTRVFQLGMKSTMNTTSNINESIYLLSLQSGC